MKTPRKHTTQTVEVKECRHLPLVNDLIGGHLDKCEPCRKALYHYISSRGGRAKSEAQAASIKAARALRWAGHSKAKPAPKSVSTTPDKQRVSSDQTADAILARLMARAK